MGGTPGTAEIVRYARRRSLVQRPRRRAGLHGADGRSVRRRRARVRTVVAVWGPTGAPGRTTIAVTLATELAALGITVLVDADTYGGSVAQAVVVPRRGARHRGGHEPRTRARSTCRPWPGWRRRRPRGSGCSPAYPRRSGGRRSAGRPGEGPHRRPVPGPGRSGRLRLQPRGRRGAQLRHPGAPPQRRHARLSPWPTRSSSWAGATRSACSGWFAGCRSWAPSRRLSRRSASTGSVRCGRLQPRAACVRGAGPVRRRDRGPLRARRPGGPRHGAPRGARPGRVCTRLAGTAGGALDRREGGRRSGRTGPAPPPRLRISR